MTALNVSEQVLAMSGGDPFDDVLAASVAHQREHGCGLHAAGGPVMQLAATLVRAVGAERVLDLGCGLGYSTLWLASAAAAGAEVIGIDSDAAHIDVARRLAADRGGETRITYRVGAVADVLPQLPGQFDAIHDDAWFGTAPSHFESMVALLRPGGVLTMANWFLLVDALTGEQRNDWAAFAGPTWASDTRAYAEMLAARDDLVITWVTAPPLGLAVKRS